MSPRPVVVTGIAGQDGSYLAELLVAQGREVVGVVRGSLERELPNLAAVRDRVRLVSGDLLEPGSLREAIEDAAPAEIYHLAAPAFVPDSWRDPAATFAAIATGTAVVLEAARQVEARVLVASSPEIFRRAEVSPQDEGTPRGAVTPYGAAKLAAHELVGVLRGGDGLHACAVVPYNHESPRRPPYYVTRKITRAAAAVSLGRASEVVLGDLDAVRDWSHAADVVRGMALALGSDEPGDYVLASGVGRTVREFAEAAFAVVGLEADRHIRVDPSLVRPEEPTPLVGDATRARELLAWTPEIDFEALVAEMVEADVNLLRA